MSNKASRLRLARGFEAIRSPKLRYNPKKETGNAVGATDRYGTSYSHDGNGTVRRGLKAKKITIR